MKIVKLYQKVGEEVVDLDEKYLPKSGGTLTDKLYITLPADMTIQDFITMSNKNIELGVTPPDTSPENRFSQFSFADKNNATFGWTLGFVETNETNGMILRTTNFWDAYKQYWDIGVACTKDGQGYGYAPYPRGLYNNDIDTVKASIDRHLVKISKEKSFYVGGENASDTEDLFSGRGESPDKPFATLEAAYNYVVKNYMSGLNNVKLVLQSDITIETGFNMNAPFMYSLVITSDSKSTIRNIIFKKNRIYMIKGMIIFRDVNFVAQGTIDRFLAANYDTLLQLQGDINFSGTVSNCAIEAASGGTIVAYDLTYGNNITGTVTGKRYKCINGGRILTNGKGANFIPGTEAGIIDASSIYF